MNVFAQWQDYVTAKNFSDTHNHITLEQYLHIEFVNFIPEIVCEILAYLSNYIHHRSEDIPYQIYERMLICQITGESLATEEMKKNYLVDGWRYTPRGLDKQVEDLSNYQTTVMSEAQPSKDDLD